ncbi:uncharacterized protein A1O5_04777 [Cladophialophora psammophila CBS 110553]|uniref:Nephrocystin 3-like N-terminal domain-containing protein n=1 Tax=Cladophialophora psammophila CBS 110553 TaxID=1182543 RepID=W9WWE4_9EURO|nr:uncharacterized protein A1O5_04777 [Cladophialophora psammophila CBS 110553]EXJ72273.1 hypothetical protein A1O5_04777 [Cladophialophora psammophila CBS 110553]
MEPAKSYIPDLDRQSLAVDFIENRLGKYHPGFATPPARYDPALDSFIIWTPPVDVKMQLSQTATTPQQGDVQIFPRPPAKPVAALKFWDLLFARAMSQFKMASEEPKGRETAGFSIRDKTHWTAVFDQLEKARDVYFEGKKPTSTVRNVYRKLADRAAPVALDVTKLVPDMNSVFVTPVVASIRIILEAVQKAAEVRKEMQCAFDDIDIMFSEIELFLQAFPGDENIVQASVELIMATFSAIEAVIGFFLKSALNRMGRAILSRENYEQQLLDTLQNVESKSQRLLREAKNSGLLVMSEGMRRILARQEKLHHESKDYFKLMLDTLLKELAANRKELNFLHVAVQSISRPASPNPPPYESAAQRHIDPQDLLDWINIPNVADSDLKFINEKRQIRVPMNEQARAEQLIQVRQLKDWMVSPTSSQLLIHGDYQGKQDISGLSLFCSSLAQSLVARAPQYIPLVFFCGLHTDRNVDDYTGGLAIIQNFICQLLCQFDFDKKLLANDVGEDRIRDGDIGKLCSLFELLVKQLPSTVVLFCLIDGIVYYERKEFVNDLGLVLVTLLKISEQSDQAAVKVLVTSPTVTTSVRKPFPHDLILSMASMAHSDKVASKWRLERQLRVSQEPQIDDEAG